MIEQVLCNSRTPHLSLGAETSGAKRTSGQPGLRGSSSGPQVVALSNQGFLGFEVYKP